MKLHHMALTIFMMTAPTLTLAVSIKDQETYKLNYSEQIKPVIMQKLGLERPDLSPSAIKNEAQAFADKMATCQLEGLSHFSEPYLSLAITPIVNGEQIDTTTLAVNQQLKADIDAGKIEKDKVMTMIQIAQESVQMCINS
jgi:hypothetical protein